MYGYVCLRVSTPPSASQVKAFTRGGLPIVTWDVALWDEAMGDDLPPAPADVYGEGANNSRFLTR